MSEQMQIDEVTPELAKHLTKSERKKKIEELEKYESQIRDGINDQKSFIHEMVFTSEKAIFQRWASYLKQLHYLNKYEKPITTICDYICKRVGHMNLPLEKKENLIRNAQRSLDQEFKDPEKVHSGDNLSPENTSAFRPIEESLPYFVAGVSKEYCDIMSGILGKFMKHLENPQIREDFEKIVSWEEIALACSTLQQLVTPIKDTYKDFAKIDEQLAKHHSLKNMEESINIRQSVDCFRNAMRLLVDNAKSYRYWAHKFGISPRQHQRVRERDEDWPEMPTEQVIRDVIGSTACPGCKIDLITKEKYYDTPPDEIFIKYQFRGRKYKIPDQYKNKGLNPIEIAEKVFGKELKLVPVEA